MLELNELLELEEVIRDVLNDDLERILIELNRTGELETFSVCLECMTTLVLKPRENVIVTVK